MKENYPALAIANEFLRLAVEESKTLTPMQLVKLVYLAHGWNLGIYSRPLIHDDIEVWKHGPVIPSIYHAFKTYGNQPIITSAKVLPEDSGSGFSENDFIEPRIDDTDYESNELLSWIWKHYGHLTGTQLSELTHKKNTPWDLSRQKMMQRNRDQWQKHYTIDNACIAEHYRKLAEDLIHANQS